MPNLALKPVVVAGEGMRLGDCVIESEVGTVDLGVRSQLGEIERGFFDRAGAPAASMAGRVQAETCAARNAASGEAQRMTPLLERYFARLERGQPWRWRGQVLESVGQTIESAGPPASVGECCEIAGPAGPRACGRGDRVSRLECAVDAGGDDGGHSLRRSGVVAGE